MDTTALQKSLAEMGSMFQTTMEEFEAKLLRSKSPASDIPSLTSEFAVFKAFMVASLHTLQDQIAMLSNQVDSLEMRGRRKILLLHGIPEASQENTEAVAVKTVSEMLKQPGFTTASIGRCHRMGRATSDKPRPILCKFREIAVRDQVWSSKTSLKATGITLSEFLTKTRHEAFMTARKRFGVSNCWTRQGYVFVLGPGGIRHRVSNIMDLSKIPLAQAPEISVPKAVASAATATVKDVAGPSKSRRAVASRK